jgi:hypothetical protein
VGLTFSCARLLAFYFASAPIPFRPSSGYSYDAVKIFVPGGSFRQPIGEGRRHRLAQFRPSKLYDWVHRRRAKGHRVGSACGAGALVIRQH